MIRCYLHQIITQSEHLSSNSRPVLIDQIQELLGIAAHCPRRHRLGNRGNPKEAYDQDGNGRQSRLRGAAILRGGASAATVESHYLQASANMRRA